MADKKIHLRVITPTEIKFDEKVNMAIMRCTTGDLGVLAGHEARSAVLDFGILRIFSDISDMRMIAVYGGLVEIKADVVTILANDAEWPQDIDFEAACAEQEGLERKLRAKNDGEYLDIQRDQIKLRRALVQIEVSSYPLISK
jgi:F-type H+-transporting ATPase subunit epsilon